MLYKAPTLGLILASPAFAAVLPLGARDVLEARQGGGGPFDGEATTFTGSPKASCGAPLAADAIAVALNGDWQTGTSPNLAACGKQITITNSGNGLQGSIMKGSSKGKTITATVSDTCPECDRTHIDLTTGAWNALTDNSAGGVVGVTWSFVGGPPSSSGGGSSSTTPTTDSGSGTSTSPGTDSSSSTNPDSGSGADTDGAAKTVSKVAAQKVGSPQKFNLATLPQGGDLASTAALQQTGTGSIKDGAGTGSGESTSGKSDSITGTGSIPGGTQEGATGTGGGTGSGTGSGTPASGSGTPASGSGTPASGSGTPASGSGTPASGSGTPASGSGTPASGSGTAASDPGTPASDPGTPASDPGTPASDPGTPASDPGTPSTKGQSTGASGGVAGKFYQCGGQSWSGPTSCESGTTCQAQNQYYSQCL